MDRPAILVLVTPHVYASVIARAIWDAGIYDVTVIDFTDADPTGSESFAAAITSVPVQRDCAPVVIQLPDSFDEPVLVRIGDVTTLETVDAEHPLEDVVRLLHRYVGGAATPHAGGSAGH